MLSTVADPYRPHLEWVDAQRQRMCDWVAQWASVNSGSRHLAGLETFTGQLVGPLGALGGDLRLVELDPLRFVDSRGVVCEAPLGKAIHITKRQWAPLRVFLGIHIDTVYGIDHPFQEVRWIDKATFGGPGVADAKGGLAVMLVALEALERSGLASRVGWEVLLNPDEEIGSPGSAPLLARAATRNHLGLVFEPALPDGTLAGSRGGSGNFTVVVRGRSAHAGRHFDQGRNAIEAMARLISDLGALNGRLPGVTVNVGQVEGGGPVNIVPDLGICRFNVRVTKAQDQGMVDAQVSEIIARIGQSDGISVQLHGGWTSPPKMMEDQMLHLCGHVELCGQQLGVPIRWQHTAGVCDGNRLAASGLPNVDTLGPRGGHIHSSDEYLLLDSLTERAKLTALLLMKLATGELAWSAFGA